jgi:hypothetical protein
MVRMIVLHSTATHGPAFLFDLLDAAIWLLVRQEEDGQAQGPRAGEGVRIVLHRVPWPHSARSIGMATARRSREWAGRLRAVGDGARGSGAPVVSLYNRVYKRRERVAVTTGAGPVTIELAPYKPAAMARHWLTAYRAAKHHWIHCHPGGELAAQRFLRITHRGVLIGDLIAGTAIRAMPAAGGSLKRCRALRRVLRLAVRLTEYACEEIEASGPHALVFSVEPTYLHAIYRRSLRVRGATVLEPGKLEDFAGDFRLHGPDDPWWPPNVAAPMAYSVPTATERAEAEQYLRERLEQPRRHLAYMLTGQNRSDGALLDADGRAPSLGERGLYPVLFLHDFDDGQYYYGNDGFDDLWDWTTFTIDTLLANSAVVRVFIKAHPNAAGSGNSGDVVARRRLQNRYATTARVSWLASDTSPRALEELGHIVGITHHGSVAEELTFCGIPVIASTRAPWGERYRFASLWNTPAEYGRILRGLSIEEWRCPTRAEHGELLRFVRDFRLAPLTIATRTAWTKYALWRDGSVPEITARAHRHYANLLGELRLDAEGGHAFLTYLAAVRRGELSDTRMARGCSAC